MKHLAFSHDDEDSDFVTDAVLEKANVTQYNEDENVLTEEDEKWLSEFHFSSVQDEELLEDGKIRLVKDGVKDDNKYIDNKAWFIIRNVQNGYYSHGFMFKESDKEPQYFKI